MAGTYNLRVSCGFAAAHQLRGYPGDCSRLHGHNWRVEAEIKAQQLDAVGMGLDFREIRRELRAIAKRLDHRYLNEIEPFDEINPTAENIARYFFHELGARLNCPAVTVDAVTVWENEHASVRYTEQEA